MIERASVELQNELAPRNARGLLLKNPVLLAATCATRYGFEYADRESAGVLICTSLAELIGAAHQAPFSGSAFNL